MSHPISKLMPRVLSRISDISEQLLPQEGEEEMEKLEDYFSDVDVLNVPFSEMEIDP